MDPDGLSILIATASTFGALAAAYRAGAVSASEPERQQSGILGFSDRMAGLCAAFVFACGFFVYGFLRIFAQAPWWTLLCLAALAALAVLLYSLGRAKGRIKEKSGFTAACMLGAPLAAPAKLVFKALGLSAQSDVTEEDVLSFVDDVEEHDLIDESQKKMITNIFELDDVTAGDVMTHRTEIVSVEENTPAADAVRLSLEHGFSRLPVYRKSLPLSQKNHPLFFKKRLTNHSKFAAKPIDYILISIDWRRFLSYLVILAAIPPIRILSYLIF